MKQDMLYEVRERTVGHSNGTVVLTLVSEDGREVVSKRMPPGIARVVAQRLTVAADAAEKRAEIETEARDAEAAARLAVYRKHGIDG